MLDGLRVASCARRGAAMARRQACQWPGTAIRSTMCRSLPSFIVSSEQRADRPPCADDHVRRLALRGRLEEPPRVEHRVAHGGEPEVLARLLPHLVDARVAGDHRIEVR